MALTKVHNRLIEGAAVNVKDFGAVGDGVTDDTSAFTTALQNLIDKASVVLGAVERESPIFYIPAGTYLVSSGWMSGYTQTDVRTVRIMGEGWYNSSIVLNSDGAHFDSNVTSKGLFWVFSDLAFYGDVNIDTNPNDGTFPVNSNRKFMVMNASSGIQGFKFNDCLFSRFGTTFSIEGENNESEIKFYDCKVVKNGTWMQIANPQSLNNEHFGCDFEQYVGNLVYFPSADPSGGTAGGGSIRFFGGSIIPFDAGSAKKLVQVDQGTATFNLPTVYFNSVRAELRHDNNGIVEIAQAANSVVVFENSSFLTAFSAGGTKEMCSVGHFGSVYFNNCAFGTSGTAASETWVLNGSQPYGNNGFIYFDKCTNHPSSDDITFDTTSGTNFGAVIATNSREFDYGATGEIQTTKNYNATYDISKKTGRDKEVIKPHRVSIMRGASPYNASNGSTVVLPKNAVILRIVGYIPPSGTSSASITYTLADGNGVTLFSVTTALQKNGTYFDKTPADFATLDQGNVGTATLDRTMTFSANAGAHQVMLGYGYIEYV